MNLHLRYVLVFELQTINAEYFACVIGGVFALKFCNHLPAAAGIARDGVADNWKIPGHDPFANQRPYQSEKTGGIAAGIAHAFRSTQLVTALFLKFGESVC